MSVTTNAPASTVQTALVTATGNVSQEYILNIVISPVAVAAATSAEQTFSVPGLLLGDFVELNKPSAQAGLGIANSRVSAPGVLAITFINATAGSVTPTPGEAYYLAVTRPVASQVAAGLPSSLPLLGD